MIMMWFAMNSPEFTSSPVIRRLFVPFPRVILTMESTSVFQRLKTMKMLNNMGTKSFSIMVIVACLENFGELTLRLV